MAQDITGSIDQSLLVDFTQADAGDVKTPLNNFITVINNMLNGAQAFDQELLNGLASAPSNPASGDGMLYYDSVSKVIKVLDSSGNNRMRIAGIIQENSTQSIPDITATVATYSTETLDTDGMATLGTNNDRLTIRTAGLYALFGRSQFAGSASGTQRRLRLLKNTASIEVNADGPLGASGKWMQIMGFSSLAVNDYIQLEAYQDTGGALNVQFTILIAVRLG